jgi:tRNA threonylcarbamoyladenosine biosynthesis protein TsaB
MALILSIETSTDTCSVSIHEGIALLAYLEIQISKSHSESLTLMIEQATKFSKRSLKDIDAIALSKGPGSYTGLRVGTSTAKGLAMALDKPLIAVNTLASMAQEVSTMNFTNAHLVPMLDARRMEVYCSVFNSEMEEVIPTNALILDDNSFSEILEERSVVFFGDGSDKFMSLTKSSNAFFVKGIVPKARNIGALALVMYEERKFENIHSFEPFYLKDFVMRKN